MTKKATYHHGALRDALVNEALLMIEEGGLQALSLRRLAARLGVSHAAPEHHFPTLKSLLTAMALVGFTRFEASMASERASSPDDPVSQMRAASRGYLAFAEKQPALFRLMFTVNLLDWSDEALLSNARASYRHLEEICAPAADARGLVTREARTGLEQLVWSQIHGHAHLAIDQKLDQAGDECRPAGQPLDMASLLFGAS